MNELNGMTLPGEARRGFKVVYTIVERGEGEQKRAIWLRVGTAWPNRDDSLRVKLDAAPTNGELHIRDYEPFDPNRTRKGNDPFSSGDAS